MKVMVIGLDGACMDLIERWANEGELPYFAKLMKEGTYGRLESVIPTLTIPAWNCMTTGKNPGKIGCFSFLQKSYGSYNFRPYFLLVDKETDIWDIISFHNKKSFIFNLANIQSAYRINGYMVAGCLCISDDSLAYPKTLKDKLYKFGYEKDIGDIKTLGSLSDREHSKIHMAITNRQTDTILKIMDEKDWDFVFLVLNELDRIQHRFWHKEKIVLKHYKNIDKVVKKIGEKDDYTIIIVSDHGFGPNDRVFHINEWLLKNGLLKIKISKSKEIQRQILSILKKPTVAKAGRLIMRFSLPRKLQQNLLVKTGEISVEWSKTKAFGFSFGHIYINLKGRESNGIVKRDDYEELRTEIIEGLKKISVNAHRSEDLYNGKYMKMAPDIVIETDENVGNVSINVIGRIFVDGFGGMHDRWNGIFMAHGPDIKENFKVNARVYDIVPTILYMYGLPLPKDVDGRILTEIFKKPKDEGIKFMDYDKLIISRKVKKLKRGL